MPKTIVVGIGGTGFEVIRNLRKKIVEANPRTGLATYGNLGFFYIDTDPKEMEFDAKKKKLWEVMGQDISLRDGEYVRVQAPTVGAILDNLDGYPQLNDWLPIDNLQGMDVAQRDTPGAQQLRPLGRMIFTLCAHDVKDGFLRVFGRLREEGQDPPEVYIACSLSGGTGGGMFLDLGYSVRHWLAGRGLTTAFLVLPDLTLNRDRRYFANAYGALMDLNYFSQARKSVNGRDEPIKFHLAGEAMTAEPGPPFDDCYLLGTQNQEGVVLSLDALPEMIAHRIYLCLDRGLDAQVRALRNNAAMKRGVYLYDPVNRNQFSQNFSSFGLSAIVYPTEEIKEIVVYQILEAVLKSWAEAPPVPNVNQEVQRNLSSHQLVNDYLLANKDVFGKGNNHGEIETEVDQLLDEKLKSVTQKPREASLNNVFNSFLSDFRGGMDKYYNIAEANKTGAADILAGNVRSYICRSLLKPDLGVPYAISYINELKTILGTKKQEYITIGSLDSKIKGSEASKTAAIGQVTAAEGQIMFAERDARNALVTVRQAMSIHFKAKVNKRAYAYGVLVLDLAIERLERLAAALEEWQIAVETIRKRAKRELDGVQERLKNLRENTHLINGKLLFDENQVAEIMAAIPVDQVSAYINERIAEGTDVIEMRLKVDATLESGYRLALSWLNEHAQQVISAKNIAQKLLERYPGTNNPERAEVLRSTVKKSAAFVNFDQAEVNIYERDPEASYDKTDQNAKFQLAGILDTDEGRRQEVVQVRQELLISAQMPVDRVRPIVDTNQIIFISEITAFPLRVLSSLKRLKEYYQLENSQARRSLPLLIAKSYQPPMGDLQLITRAQLRQSQENEENFLLGWIAGDIRPEENRAERRMEIHLKYREMGQDRFARIGSSREDAFDAWRSLDGRFEEEKKLLAEIIHNRTSTWRGYDEREKVGAALDRFLAELEKTLPFGVQSAVYRYQQDIVTRLKKKHDLYRTDSPVSPLTDPASQSGGQVAVGDEGVARGQFRAYVADLLDRRKGTLSDGLRASIARRQKELGLTQPAADAILREEQSVYGKADLSPEEQYRALVSKKLATNMILSPDDEDELLDFEVRNHISEEAAQRIRAEVDAARK